MDSLPDLPAGIYEHFKGHFYQAFGYSRDANTEDGYAVSYFGLEVDGAQDGPRLHHRIALSTDPKVEAWWDFLHADKTKCTHHDGTGNCSEGRSTKPRFRYIGPEWHADLKQTTT